jgi:hypothetical protein
MSNGDLTQYDDGEVNDGFNGSFSSDRTIKGTQLVWNDAQHWRDRDGLKPPAQLLVVGVDAILQRWKEGLPQVIRDKPLPDPDDLNSAIPISEWEVGIDGQKRPPWQDTVVVYTIDPTTGGFYTYVSSTTGGRIAVDHLKESVAGMRMLRGGKVLPLVTLAERPMKTRFGVKSRPAFEIVDWKELAFPFSGKRCRRRPCRRPSLRPSRARLRRPRLSPSPPRPSGKPQRLSAWAPSSPSRRARSSTTRSHTSQKREMARRGTGEAISDP